MDALRSAFGWSTVKDDGDEGAAGPVGGASTIEQSAVLTEMQKQFPDGEAGILDGYLR